MSEFDVIVAGAGPAGLAAACLLALSGKRVALVAQEIGDASDPRTVALMQPSMRMLTHIGVWPGDLEARTQPLKKLRIVDDTGSALKAPTLVFDPLELGEAAFGWNFPLGLLIPALHARAVDLGVIITESNAASAQWTSSDVTVVTTSGARFTSHVALAADGRSSVLREAAGIGTNRWAYEQCALATSFDHSGSHDGISTEYHKGAGPFTTVPMPGNRSSLVWMERPDRAAELMVLPDRELAVQIQLGTHGELGRVSNIGARRLFPMQGLVARDFARNRIVLIGEAGHVVPPIGAQGLNMSLRDAAQAAELMEGEDDPGNSEIIASYDALRRRDVQPRQQVIDMMNRSLLSGFMVLEAGRAVGLSMLAQIGPLRRAAMQYGLAPSFGLPRIMRKPEPQGSNPALIA